MERFLVIQQVESEDPGVFSDCLARAAVQVDTVRIWEGDPVPSEGKGYRGVLVLGGPMNVGDAGRLSYLRDELELIRDCHGRGVPVLGVCLGAQLIAAALGGRVYAGALREIGWYEVELTGEGTVDPLFRGFPEKFTAFQWHGQTFDLPAGAVRLAGSALFSNQAFRLGKVWAVQFHFEVTGRHVRRWLEENPGELNALPYIDREKILRGIAGHETACNRLADSLFERFLALAPAD